MALDQGVADGEAKFALGVADEVALEVGERGQGFVGALAGELGLHQADVVLGVAEFGVAAAAHRLGEAALGTVELAGLQGELAEPAQARKAVGRQLGGALQGLAGLGGTAGLFLHAGEQLVRLDEARVAGDQVGEQVFGLHPGLAHHQHARQPERGPGDGARGEDLAVQRRGLVDLADLGVQLGLQAHEVDQVLRVAVARLAAGDERADRVAELHELPHRQEGVALLEGAQQAHAQALGGERLEDVVVGDELAGADHALVVALAGDHHEHRVGRDDPVLAQVLEQVLAVLALAEVVFGEDEVEGLRAQTAHRHARRHGELRRVDADRGEHVAQLRTHARLGFDDEDLQALGEEHRMAWRTHAGGVPCPKITAGGAKAEAPATKKRRSSTRGLQA